MRNLELASIGGTMLVVGLVTATSASAQVPVAPASVPAEDTAAAVSRSQLEGTAHVMGRSAPRGRV